MMSNRLRKQDAHRARSQRHRDARRDKRKAAQSHHKQTPKSQRRTVQFPAIWNMPVKAWTRSKAA